MKVLVTGATGFLGSAIAVELLKNPEYDVYYLIRQNLARLNLCLYAQGYKGIITEDKVIYGNLEIETLPEFDYVFNSAGYTSFVNNGKHVPVNVEQTLTFVSTVKRTSPNLKNFVHIGTGCDHTNINDYSRSKKLGKELIQQIDIPLLVLKPSILIGNTNVEWMANYSIYWVIRAVFEIGGFTFTKDDVFNSMAVNEAAEQIVAHIDSTGEIMLPGKNVKWQDIFTALGDSNKQWNYIGCGDLVKTIQPLYGDIPAQKRLLVRALQLYSQFIEYSKSLPNGQSVGLDTYIAKCKQQTDHLTVFDLMMNSDLRT